MNILIITSTSESSKGFHPFLANLVASKQLFKRVCLSVFVRLSVRPFVCPTVLRLFSDAQIRVFLTSFLITPSLVTPFPAPSSLPITSLRHTKSLAVSMIKKTRFCAIKKKALRTDGLTYGRTDRHSDRPSFRDARTQLKPRCGRTDGRMGGLL